MSQADIIRDGQIQKRKLEIIAKVPMAKAALRALIAEATYVQDKHPREINTDTLKSHLEQLINLKAEIERLYAELAELEY